MTKTECLNKVAQDGEERMLLARVLDKLDQATSRNIPSHTEFLSPAHRASVEKLLNLLGHPDHLFYGGYPEAERTMCFFMPSWQSPEDVLCDPPIALLCATYQRGGGDISHRDILGALLGLGIVREKVGDLLVGEGCCHILLLPELAPFVAGNLDKAGRTSLVVEETPISTLEVPQFKVKIIKDTVATLRLDAVMSSGFSLSRGKCSDYISTGKVLLNHKECKKNDKGVAQGDTISCRGLGKCRVTAVGGLSKKGRIMIEMERYL